MARLQARKPLPSKEETQIRERCADDVAYFVAQHCQIYNATIRRWIPFDLWEAQAETLELMVAERKLVVCKARQLGLSWLSLAYILWVMLFRPAAAVLIFSKREFEAMELLRRLKGMYIHLPAYLRVERVVVNSLHDWELSNGSRATAFATTGGRSFTASIVLMDEADFMPDLDDVMAAVQPTIDAGGQMIVISTVDKDRPESSFKNLFRGARDKATDWASIFLPWWTRPGRDRAWYERIRADILHRTQSTDELFAEYPANVAEAFAPRSQNKRISNVWLSAIFAELEPLDLPSAPDINDLVIYHPAQRVIDYVIGMDPAEGNPASDDSALTVLSSSGEEIAMLRGKFEPGIFAAYAAELSAYYNYAPIMVERNNHGHSVILWLRENARHTRLLAGLDGKPGWLSNVKGKSIMYTNLATYAREHFQSHDTMIHSFATYNQIASIEGASLRAPDGQMDDLADSYALAVCGLIAIESSPVAMRQARVKGREGGANVRSARRKRVKR